MSTVPGGRFQVYYEKIKKAISVCKDVLDGNRKMAPSSATKNSSIFESVQSKAQAFQE